MKRLLNTLYVTNEDAIVRKKDDAIAVYLNDEIAMSVPFHLLEGVVLYGHAGCSMAVLRACASRGIGVALLGENGQFEARISGPTSGNILLRKQQFLLEASKRCSLHLAKRFVVAKLHNSKIVLQHYARDYPAIKTSNYLLLEKIEAAKSNAMACLSLDDLRGVEGDAAHAYFSALSKVLKVGKSAVAFNGRNRRPPKDPVNACLSLFYTMLSREISTACEVVGLDPQLGFLHACRPGRMSLALDLIEELRSPIVDRFVVSLFNRGQLTENSFKQEGEAVFFKDSAFKEVLSLWQQRKQESFMHPFLKESMPLGLLPMIQSQLLARYIRGDLNDYPACMWR